MRKLAIKFKELFDGAERGYGYYDVTGAKDEGGKRIGNAVTKHDAVTLEMWEDHLAGKRGLGIIPIKETTVKFGAIDIDVYDGIDHKKLVQTVQKHKLPLVVCRSKSGGAHLYLFCSENVPANIVQKKLGEWAAFIGYGNSEIFPKQTAILVERGDRGSWINMPYFGGLKGMRYAVRVDGDAFTPEEFLEHANGLRVDEDELKKMAFVVTDDFVDGPPCLQHLGQLGFPQGTRNDGLYNISVYLRKAFPEAWEAMLEDYNARLMDPPLKSTEVQGVIKSGKRKDYAFKCSKTPIAPHCNSAVCRTRKFGVGGNAQGFPNLGLLSKLTVKPPLWFWDVDGQRLELTTPELQDPVAFQRKCMEMINAMPQIPTKQAWNRIVSDAMEKVVVIEASPDASPEGAFWNHVEKFCTGKARAMSMEEMILGKPYFDEESGKTYFRLPDLESYLDRVRFKEFKTGKIASLLRDAGAQHHFEKLKGKGTNYWSMPAFDKQTQGHDVPETLKGREVF